MQVLHYEHPYTGRYLCATTTNSKDGEEQDAIFDQNTNHLLWTVASWAYELNSLAARYPGQPCIKHTRALRVPRAETAPAPPVYMVHEVADRQYIKNTVTKQVFMSTRQVVARLNDLHIGNLLPAIPRDTAAEVTTPRKRTVTLRSQDE